MIRYPYSLLDGESRGRASFPVDTPRAARTPAARPAIVVDADGSVRSRDAIALGALLAEVLTCDLRVLQLQLQRSGGRADRAVRAVVVASSHAARRLQSVAGCPVVLAPRGYARGRPSLCYVGCGFDTSAQSRAAWRQACAVAEAVRGEVRVYAVRDQHAGRSLHHELLELIGSADTDLCVEPVVAAGDAERVLREATRSLDLLVVGASRHGAIGSLLMGSVARGLLREPSCPVMVVPG